MIDGARLSRLGFGVSGAHGTALVRRAETVGLIEAAAGLGVTVFDTAPAYGGGEAERRLGAAVSDIGREAVFLSTKAGLFAAGPGRKRRDFRPEAIERSVRESLARLEVDGVDLLFLHGAAPGELTPALFQTLTDLKAAGAFLALGACGRGAELDAALETGRFAALMAPLHPWIDPPAHGRLARAKAAGLAVFAIETAGPARVPLRFPRKPADLYPLAQGLKARARRKPDGAGRLAAPEALAAALADPLADVVLMTTTRLAHLEANAAL